MSSLERQFGQVIRAARKRNAWSQERLAEAADLNRSYLGEIERGVVSPSLATIHKLALALGSPISALIETSERTGLQAPRAYEAQLNGGDSL
jgi:transcriptional regulator with XRE-family HTH domain